MRIWKNLPLVIMLFLLSCQRQLPDTSLIGWWKFDEGKGIVVRDASGHGLDGIVTGGEWTNGKCGKAIHFDGRSYIEVKYRPILDSMTTELTVCAWVKRDTSTSWNTVVSREIVEGWSEYIGLAVYADTALFSVDPDGSHYSNVKDTAACPVGEWTHLAGTFRGSTFTLYINGKPSRNGHFNPPIRYSDQNPLVLGGNTNSQGKQWVDLFHGTIDDIRLYKRALADSEIREMALRK